MLDYIESINNSIKSLETECNGRLINTMRCRDTVLKYIYQLNSENDAPYILELSTFTDRVWKNLKKSVLYI